MKRCTVILAAVLIALAAGCGSVERLWGGGPAEQKRVRAGVTEFSCDSNKKLQVLFDAAGKTAWVIFPEREFRLDAVPGGSGAAYSNGRTTLTATAEGTRLEEGSSVTFANCKRAAGA